VGKFGVHPGEIAAGSYEGWRGALRGRNICHCLLTSGGKQLARAGFLRYSEVWGVLSANEERWPQ